MNLESDIITLHAADGQDLALHRWDTPTAEAAVFYIHGIQSHSGWLFETGEALRRRGVAVYSLDRRGSGRSGGRRGHIDSALQLLDDYRLAYRAVSDRAGTRPVVAVGQSFGGSVLAALLVDRLIEPEAAVFCAPALGQRRYRGRSREQLAKLSPHDAVPIGLDDADYTRLERYRVLMANDGHMLRQLTARTLASMCELEELYLGTPTVLYEGGPVYFVSPKRDRIINIGESHAVLRRLFPESRSVVFEAAAHYLEFSSARERYWSWLASVAGALAASHRHAFSHPLASGF